MKKLLLVVGLCTVVAAAVWSVQAFTKWRVNARTDRFREEVENLFVGLQQYKEYCGSYPGGANADVARALKGHNPKNVIILVGRKLDLSPKGEFVDPWGTPLKIYFSDSGVMVRSAGPNRRFDDSTSLECDDFFRSN